MQVKDIEGKEFARINDDNDIEPDNTNGVIEDSQLLNIDQFQLLNLLGLEIEIEFSEQKVEVLKNVHIRSVSKDIKSSSDSIKKTIVFEAKDIEK